ncbi:cardiolipin synthase (CMP-forming) [Corythoichthys intestinalis]|uniref:cardiolipin synthase (CMP-forming) n=1 Tax=Corythoichthys intestinalis TaxID=161448 RepID=UPI0025A5459C|nr:cardiolipin synthase (CMP-forming) [Corythoichthys intestinalis]XP_061794394.1 cardiolipin synthase (CMP-forming)-like [Nerophis lumbriciformis]
MIVLCFRTSPAPICRKATECLLSARRGAASSLEAATWRLGRAPVTAADGRVRTFGLSGTSCRLGPLPSTWWRPCRTLLVLRGSRSRLAVNSRALLSTGGRGLSGKSNQEASDKPGEATTVPGQGLFKFKELYENPWTVPNLLCVCRIVLAPFLGYLIIQQHFHLSLALFSLAGATDLLDGYIARTWPTQKSALGSALDPLADKILISILYISLTYADIIPAPLTALVVFRDIGLIAAVFWVRYKTVPPPVTLSKFFNPCYTTAQLKPTLFSKVNTAIQLVLVAASLAAPVFQFTDSILLQGLWFVTAMTTTASGYSYWHYGRKTVRVLNTRSS